MKPLRQIAALLLATLGLSCSESSEIYYTTTYPIVRLDVEVKIENQEETESPLLDAIRADVLGHAPVQVGGSYRLEYGEHDCGRLCVRTGEEGETLYGAFYKQPGASQFELFFRSDDVEYDYVCTESSYLTDRGSDRALLRIDLTEYYRERYPEEAILRVCRLEYTDHTIR